MMEKVSYRIRQALSYVKIRNSNIVAPPTIEVIKVNTPIDYDEMSWENQNRNTGMLILKSTIVDCETVSNDRTLPTNVINNMLSDSRAQVNNIAVVYDLILDEYSEPQFSLSETENEYNIPHPVRNEHHITKSIPQIT